MLRKTLHVELLECVLVILALGPICRGVLLLIAPLYEWCLIHLPGGETAINSLLLTELLQFTVMLFLVWFFWRKCHERSWEELGLAIACGHNWLGRAVLNGILLFIVMLVVSAIMNYLLPGGLEMQNVAAIIETADTPWERLVPLIVTGILAPVSEEILFRGFIFNCLREKFGMISSVLLTAAVFGCMHFDPIRVLPLMLGGIWLNVLYVRSGSLYVAMGAHGVWNIIMTMLIYMG